MKLSEFKMENRNLNRRIRNITEIYENTTKYIETRKIFTTTPNVIIIEKFTFYKLTGNKTTETKRMVNGRLSVRNSTTIEYEN